jgi:SM-20-related protein
MGKSNANYHPPDSFELFLLRGFLDPETCARIQAEVRQAPGFPARVYLEGSSEPNETVRKTTSVRPAEETISFVEDRLIAQTSAIAEYFSLALNGCERPQFLLYREGDFFVRHQDVDPDQVEYDHLRIRKISIVIFLNDGSPEMVKDTFGGGALAFRQEGGDQEALTYPLIGEAGLLVAFRADTIHEVTPVTHGERLTVVSWFN